MCVCVKNSGYRPDINGYKPCRHLIRLQLLLREGCLLVAHPARRMLPSPGLTAALRSAQTHSPSGLQSHSCSGSRSSPSPGLSRTLSRCFSAGEKLLLTPKWCCLHVLLVQPNCHGGGGGLQTRVSDWTLLYVWKLTSVQIQRAEDHEIKIKINVNNV